MIFDLLVAPEQRKMGGGGPPPPPPRQGYLEVILIRINQLFPDHQFINGDIKE